MPSHIGGTNTRNQTTTFYLTENLTHFEKNFFFVARI